MEELENDLVERALTEPAEFEAAALPHLDALFRAARHTLGSPAEAEDVVQETYLQAWRSFHRFAPGTNCRAWLFKIMFHVIHHHRRKWFSPRFRAATAEEVVEESLVYEPPVPPHLTDEEVLAALQKIPPQYREVVLLADVEEFSYQETAAALGIPIGTVMSRLSRGRKTLRRELAGLARSYGIQSAADEIQGVGVTS